MAAPSKNNKHGSLLFIKEVAKYFMDFLETDFHKHKFPRRSIKFRNNDNLLIGLNLSKYPSFNKLISKFIVKGFDKESPNKVVKGSYKTNLPKNLLDLIKLQASKITVDQIVAITERVAGEIEKAGTLYAKEYDLALTNSIEKATEIIRSELAHPFVESIEKTLQNLNLGDEDNIYLIEEELTEVLRRLLENKISEVLNLFIAKEKLNLANELGTVFTVQDVKGNLTSFFENLQVADLFLELFEMERNRSILDKQDFYLYFGDISFNKIKYPIFYIPFTTHREGDTLNIEFDSQVYINKKSLEYIVQEYNALKGTKGNLQAISERIIYLSQHHDDFSQIIDSVLNELSHFFELDGKVDFFSGEHSSARSVSARISNSCYICLFDKSDEALVNDYEEILQQLSQDGGILSDTFNKLIDDFVHRNPVPFNPAIESEWDNAGTPDRLVYSSPIPLNSEQQQILLAVRKDGCNYITVQGPPGTGKSHTITAIIFDAILKNQSVLVLSDKKEALDVVEDKITQTMNKVRYDKNFQNPILRLGKTGNTYNSILTQSTIEGIKTHYRAVKKDYETVEETIDKLSNSLREDLEAEILAYSDISLKEIREYFELELYFADKHFIFDNQELSEDDDAAIELEELRNSCRQIKDVLSSKETHKLVELLEIQPQSLGTLDGYERFLQFLALALESIQKLKAVFSGKIDSIRKFTHFNSKDLEKLQPFIQKYTKLKFWLIGYLFTKKLAEKLDISFKNSFNGSTFSSPHEHLRELKNVYEIFCFAHQYGEDIRKKGTGDFDYIALAHRLLVDENFTQTLQNITALNKEIDNLKEIVGKYPKTAQKVGINAEQFATLISNKIIDAQEAEFNKQVRFLSLQQKVSKDFSNITELNYAGRMKQIEGLVTTQVTYLLDGRLIEFYEHNRSDAQTLRNIIKSKQRFPRDEFKKLKEAFPCILAGIRDYAEYIPLEPEIFDLVVIDEASQVSIAQAFPALLRAKKVLILGDKKQFSNVKAAQARSDTNREYLNGLDTCFRNNVSTDSTKLARLKKFNIKTSILEFFEFISNYTTQLLKHFRGYKEIISYSNKYFYQNSLQVMKIRGKQIDEVVKFSYLEPTEEDELYPNTNAKEVEFIITELKRLKENGKPLSVGIITPHTNQQKLLVETIGKMPEWDYFLNQLQLKIMTFDTCQGEERDIIYYSMVASPHSDKLWGVFIKDLSNVDVEEDGQIKAQRLNVGFSRAKERVHFVLSKSLEEFTGSIGKALNHYQWTLEEAKKEHTVIEVDEKSKMEPEVLNWFYQTKFWQQRKDDIEFIPQFEIGKYLKQLNPNYTHPEYKVDFLLVYSDDRHREHKIVIEYDGFREHFKDVENINEFNYQNYYSDDDIYRQKILESYGYKFLRINKFNCGRNPIANFDERIERLLKTSENANSLLANIHGTIEGLQNGAMRECPKCKEVKPVRDFMDKSLVTGYGRFCNDCKNSRAHQTTPIVSKSRSELTDKTCPRCTARMVLRNGRRGKFYGCSKFPYCRGTRQFPLP